MKVLILLLLIGSCLPLMAQTTDTKMRKEALTVLQNKCNDCHQKDKPKKVFTEANIDEEAKGIYKQVFVRKRMPKGEEVKLSETDQQQLLAWLRTRVEIKE